MTLCHLKWVESLRESRRFFSAASFVPCLFFFAIRRWLKMV